MENQFGTTNGQPADPACGSMEKIIESLTCRLAEQSELIKKLQAQVAWFQKQMFGRKSEKDIAIDYQPNLFDIAGVEIQSEQAGQQQEESPGEEEISYRRKKSQKGQSKRRETWDDLPLLETRVLEPQGVDLTRYRRMGEETTYLVGFEPGKYYRIAIVRPKYGLIDPTEPVEKGKGVIIAPLPRFPIYKGVPDASLLSEIVLQKYEYHMPFYRQIKRMAHMGMGSGRPRWPDGTKGPWNFCGPCTTSWWPRCSAAVMSRPTRAPSLSSTTRSIRPTRNICG